MGFNLKSLLGSQLCSAWQPAADILLSGQLPFIFSLSLSPRLFFFSFFFFFRWNHTRFKHAWSLWKMKEQLLTFWVGSLKLSFSLCLLNTKLTGGHKRASQPVPWLIWMWVETIHSALEKYAWYKNGDGLAGVVLLKPLYPDQYSLSV